MKLVEILAKELEEWPEGVLTYAQDSSGVVGACSGGQERPNVNSCWSPELDHWWVEDAPLNGLPVDISEDYQTAIVTKEMWESEKAKQNSLSTVASDDELWGDVKEMYNREKEEFNPIYCRDRIKEIDSLVESLEEERVSLVQALEDEGFSLIRRINKQLEECKQSHEGMSDPSNWEEGDLIECIDGEIGVYTKGSLYTFIEVSDWGSIRCVDDMGRENGLLPKCFKWHSRPQQ